MSEFNLVTFALTFFGIAAIGFLIVTVRRLRFTKSARTRLLEGSWVPVEDLEPMDEDEEDHGCYIILEFDHPVTDGDFSTYRNAYVGKSDQAHNHARARAEAIAANEDAEGADVGDRHFYVQVRSYHKDDTFNMGRTIVKVLKAEREENLD